MKTDLRWLAGNLDNGSETSAPVVLWIRSESRRKRIRLRRVWLLWSYIICVLVDSFRSFNDATNERVTTGHNYWGRTLVRPLRHSREFDSGAVKIGGQTNSPLLELALVLVCLDHVARFIVELESQRRVSDREISRRQLRC
jgi:hypothetical protein